jgi:predicted nucleotidyltransferase
MGQLDFLQFVIGLLRDSGLRYMVVGSFASGFWGEPRATYDIDLVIALSIADLPKLTELFPPDVFYLSPEAARDAILRGSQFNIIHPDSGNKIDVMVQRNTPWGQLQLSRRRLLTAAPGLELYVGAPEDIILGKLLFFREGGSEKHLRDIAGILKLRKSELDIAYLDHWADVLQIQPEWAAAQTWRS